MKRRWFIAAVAAAAFAGGGAMLLAQSGVTSALFSRGGPSGDLGAYFFSPHMARAEVVMKLDGQVHDFRIDQGRVVAVRNGSVDLLERDGSRQTVPLASDARVQIDGVPVGGQQIRPGMRVITIRDGSGAAGTVRAFTR